MTLYSFKQSDLICRLLPVALGRDLDDAEMHLLSLYLSRFEKKDIDWRLLSLIELLVSPHTLTMDQARIKTWIEGLFPGSKSHN